MEEAGLGGGGGGLRTDAFAAAEEPGGCQGAVAGQNADKTGLEHRFKDV